MNVAKADITLTWDDGRKVHMGTISIDAEKNGFKCVTKYRQRLGWELVRKGFWIMFPFRKWKTGKDGEHDV